MCREHTAFTCRSGVRKDGLKHAQEKSQLSKHNILCPAETRWISHYAPMARVLEQMPPFVAHVDLLEQTSTGAEYSSAVEHMARLMDLERVLAMAALLPVLKELRILVQVHIRLESVFCCVLQDLIHFVQC